MLLVLTFMILGLTTVAWRNGGPLLAMLISWLVSLTPVATRMINFEYLNYSSDRYVWIVALSVVAFLIGTVVAAAANPAPQVGPQPRHNWTDDLAQWLPVAKICFVAAMIAIFSTMINVMALSISFSDLAIIREEVVNAESATIFAQVASVTMWGCFFCLAFAIYFRHVLTRGQFLLFLLAGAGIFLSALMVAGRGSVFQVVLLTLVLESIRSRRLPMVPGRPRHATKMAIMGASAAFIFYITMNRTTGADGHNKAELFLKYFGASINPTLDAMLGWFGVGLRDFAIEALIYVSHPVPLFSVFVDIDFGKLFWGMHDFPFLFRQFEPIFGYSVLEAYRLKVFYLSTQGVIGVGWNTALSSLLLDFGTAGMFIFLLLQGFLSQWCWARVRRGGRFGTVLVSVLFTIAAVYMPFMGAFADTTIFLLLVFLAFIHLLGARVFRAALPLRLRRF